MNQPSSAVQSGAVRPDDCCHRQVGRPRLSLRDDGHIKLWSRRTLSHLLAETGFQNIQFRGAGRLPFLWMTMVMSGDKPR